MQEITVTAKEDAIRARWTAEHTQYLTCASSPIGAWDLAQIAKADVAWLLSALSAARTRATELEAERPDHWWRQAVIDVARTHRLDGLGVLLEVCQRITELRMEMSPNPEPPTP